METERALLETGLTACPLERLPGAEGIVMLIIHMNQSGLPPNDEPC